MNQSTIIAILIFAIFIQYTYWSIKYSKLKDKKDHLQSRINEVESSRERLSIDLYVERALKKLPSDPVKPKYVYNGEPIEQPKKKEPPRPNLSDLEPMYGHERISEISSNKPPTPPRRTKPSIIKLKD